MFKEVATRIFYNLQPAPKSNLHPKQPAPWNNLQPAPRSNLHPKQPAPWNNRQPEQLHYVTVLTTFKVNFDKFRTPSLVL